MASSWQSDCRSHDGDFAGAPARVGSGNAHAPTSSCTLSSGSCPGAGLNPRNAFSGRAVRFSTIRYGWCVSMASRIFCSAGVAAKNWTLTPI